MKQPVTSSTSSLTDAHTSANERPPERDTIVPQPLSPTEIKSSQHATEKHGKRRLRFPRKLYPSNQQPHTPRGNAENLHRNSSTSEKHIAPSALAMMIVKPTVPSQFSVADNRLQEIIHNLETPVEEDLFDEETNPITNYSKWISQSRHFLRHLMEKSSFHYIIIVLIIIDLIIVFIELTLAQLSTACLTDEEMAYYNTTQQRDTCILPPTSRSENGELALYYISLIILCVFVLEIFGAFYAFGWRRYTKILYLLDAIVIFISFILEIYFHFVVASKSGRASAGIVVLRLWKIIRAIHAIAHSISLKNHTMVEQIEKARTILKAENLQAEKTIYEYKIKIDNLTDLLEKTDQHSIRRRANTTSSTTFF